MTVELLVYLVTTIFTYAMGLLSKKKGWNEELPIAIQNIIIGIIATGIGILIHVEGLTIDEIIQAVVVGIGGAATAALYYDTKQIENK